MSYYLINGKTGDQFPVADRGLHYGDGVFETVKVQGDTLCLWRDHMARLVNGCERLCLPKPDTGLLETEARQLLQTADGQALSVEKQVLKIIVTRGSGQRGYRLPDPCRPTRIVALYPYPDYPAELWSKGVRLTLCMTRLACNRALAGIKHLNRLEQVLARSEWDDEGIVDGIMLDQQAHVIETTMSNLFFVKNGMLLTPDLSDCGVAGVMRNQVLRLAEQLQRPVQIGHYFTEDLWSADEIFITNSVHGIWPVRQINEQPQLEPGPVTRQFMDAALQSS
ncbi:MAG: aminodeoxychorismate lyase [Gammaproteobacteria bacterium]